MENIKKHKRTFLAGILSAVVMPPIVGVSRALAACRRTVPTSATALLIDSIAELESAKEIGVRILGANKPRPETVTLTHTIIARMNFDDEDQEAAVRGCSRQDIRNRISIAVKKDFSAGRVTDLEGWILSDTEANLCILAVIGANNDMQ